MSVICNNSQRAQKPRGIMSRLARDKRGATLPMMAAAVIPITAMVGAGLDMSRVYLVRTRLQQACDAGAVAVRRSMSATNTATASDTNKAEGYKFFDFNFPQGAYGTNSVTRSFTGVTNSNGIGNVDGDASAIVPTSVMKLFAVDTLTVSTSCAATVSIPNTDVMFVLDVSGSMRSNISGDTVTKLAALKAATKNFFITLGKGTDAGAGRIRYGFVPYSSHVNVGAAVKAVNSSYIMGATTGETATYRSRTAHTYVENYITGYSAESGHSPNGSASNSTPSGSSWSNYGNSGTTNVNGTNYTNRFTNVTSAVCSAKPLPYPAASPVNSVDVNSGSPVGPTGTGSTTPTYPATVRVNSYNTTQDVSRTTYGYEWKKTGTSGGNDVGTCQFRRLPQTYVRTTPTKTTQNATWGQRDVADYWTYGNRTLDVKALVDGNTVANPTFWSGTTYVSNFNVNPSPNKSQSTISSTFAWEGCLEESRTVNTITATSALSIPSGALDMMIDLKPTSAADKWRPFLPAVVYDPTGQVQWHDDNYWQSASGGENSVCPTESRTLRQYTTDVDGTTKLSTSFKNYVDGLVALGTTQHDIGLIWGARFLSPDGLMSAANSDETAPGGFAISRHIVFMTDGAMNAQEEVYGPWGISRLDGRQVPTSTTASSMSTIHNRRMDMICNAAKSKGYTIWVVGFGISSMPQALKDCASDSDHWALAQNSADLNTKFSNIASTIGGLRLTE